MKQKDIVALLRKEFGHHEVTVFTASMKNKAGILDCEIAYKGHSFWVEIKIGNDTISRLQASFIKRHYMRACCLTLREKNTEIMLSDSDGYFYFYYKNSDKHFTEIVSVILEKMLQYNISIVKNI